MKVHLGLMALLLAHPAFGQGVFDLFEDGDKVAEACREAITEASREKLADMAFFYSMGSPTFDEGLGSIVGDRAMFPEATLVQGLNRYPAFVECGLDTQDRRVTGVQVFFRGDGGFPEAPTPETIGGTPVEELPLAGPLRAASFGQIVEDSPETRF